MLENCGIGLVRAFLLMEDVTEEHNLKLVHVKQL